MDVHTDRKKTHSNQHITSKFGTNTTDKTTQSRYPNLSNDFKTDDFDMCDAVEENSTDKEVINISIKQYLKPILYCLSICGCYDFYNVNVQHDSAPKTINGFVYRIFVFLVLVLTVLKFFSAFFYLPKSDLMMNGLYMTWLCMCLLYFVVHLKSTSIRFGYQENNFRAFDDVVKSLSKNGCQCPVVIIKRRVLLGTVIGCVLVLTNMTGIGLQIRFHPVSKAFYTCPFAPTNAALTLFLLAEMIFTLIWVFPLIYVMTVCDIVKQVFNAYNSFLEKIIRRKDSKALTQIQQWRVQHLQLCELVGNLDADMGWFFASTCSLNLGLSCFSLYKLIKNSLDGFSMFLFIFWLTASLATLALLTIFAAIVNEKAHAPLDLVYHLNIRQASQDQAIELDLFMAKLTGTQVGFTTCGLLTITKDFILTVVGVFLTYFAVLYTL